MSISFRKQVSVFITHSLMKNPGGLLLKAQPDQETATGLSGRVEESGVSRASHSG
jgi:hypothetical protein